MPSDLLWWNKLQNWDLNELKQGMKKMKDQMRKKNVGYGNANLDTVYDSIIYHK